MYSQYMDGNFFPLGQPPSAQGPKNNTSEIPKYNQPQGEFMRSISQIFGGISKHFSVNQLDGGDILLVLIILFLLLEGDNLELVITLGVMLLLGLHDD